MSATAAQFAAFLAALAPDPADIAAARALAARTADALGRHFREGAAKVGADHLIVGSVGKRTAVRPLPPADVIYLLPETLGAAGRPDVPDVIHAVRRALASAFPQAAIDDGGRVVVADGSARVLVLPGFDLGGAFAVAIGERWVVTNPAAELAALRMADSLGGGRAGRLLALLKAWRAACSAPVSGFALEVLACEFARDAQARADLPGLLADFFAWVRRRTPAQFELPGGRGSLAVGDDWHGLAEAAYWRCVLAERHAASGDAAAAAEEWRRLLGPLFPAAAPRLAEGATGLD